MNQTYPVCRLSSWWGNKGYAVWPFLFLTLSVSYGLFKGDLITPLLSRGTLLGKRAAMTFFIRRKCCLTAEAPKQNNTEWGEKKKPSNSGRCFFASPNLSNYNFILFWMPFTGFKRELAPQAVCGDLISNRANPCCLGRTNSITGAQAPASVASRTENSGRLCWRWRVWGERKCSVCKIPPNPTSNKDV